MHSSTRLPLFILLLLGLTTAASAQRLEPGYLVVSSGDTLRGEVENNFWAAPPTEIRFRTSPTAAPTTYPARQLRAVGLNSGRQLRREPLLIDYAATTNPHQLPNQLLLQQRPDTVLADVLVDGPASLLGIRLGEVKHFFVRREQQPYLELSERLYQQTTREGRQQIVDGNNYRGQLKQYFGDCVAVLEAVEKTAFTGVALSNLVQLYNRECSATRQLGREVAVTKPGLRARLLVGPTVGLRYNSLRLHAESSPGLEARTLDGLQTDGRVHPQLGLFFDVLFGGRRFAAHTAITRSAYGGSRTVASPNGDAAWQGRLDRTGSITTFEVGVRALRPLGAKYQLVVGTGFCFPPFLHIKTQELRYGTTEGTRPVINNFSISTRSYYPLYGFSGTALPYLEAGLRRDRLTLLLYARTYRKESYSDPLVVASYSANPPAPSYQGYRYSGRTVSVALSLGFQLNGNSDRQTAPK
ncbi:hypothetical protein [Hymenobacter persicinus]|uniref:Outer membrane protein beta-barrel domain-containing protein n=1 Tax=Hymenobacter persicinus TaxID=2025506 RepID=A0A4Q5LEC0_9BACT|nr:hypothetical protein [Hymenobacter persicinus]RYU78765.1 hypothetical protein EWM57_12610 [Hymenobacter persicinus]